MILDRFFPREWIDSVYEIDWKQWRNRQIQGVIFDVDNTLVPHGAPATPEAIALFLQLHEMGIKTCLLSNNKEPRVASFAKQVDSIYICRANKPSVKNYKKAMKLMGTRADQTLFAGDQLFTDVYGANRSGIYGILVKPIHPKEEIQIVVKRYLEAIVLYFYKKKQKRKD